MKNDRFKTTEPHRNLSRWVMAFVLSLIAIQLSAQTPLLNLSMKNVSLHEILKEIKSQSWKDIVYNNNLIDQYSNETVELKNASLDEALSKVLQGKNLVFKIVNDVIVIEPSPDKQGIENTMGLFQKVRGTVFDAETNTPLIGASVIIPGSNPVLGDITDLDGNFTINKVPVGRCNIQVSYVGYKPAVLSQIIVNSGKEVVVNVGLRQSITQLNEVIVSPGLQKDRPINAGAAVSARSFTIEETERFAGSWGDPARMATNYAGVSTAGDQRNDIIIRGNSPTGLLWQLEDIPIPSPNHFDVLGTTGGPVSMLNNNLLARSDFFTSAFPAEYGNATSGVFDLKMRNGNNEKNEYLLQCGFNGFEGGAEGPISRKRRSSYIVNARYSMLGLVHDLLWVDGLPQYDDISFKLNFPLKSGKISVFGLGGTSSITSIEEDDKRSVNDNKYVLKSVNGSRTGIMGINFTHNFNPSTVIKTGLAWSTRRPHENVDSLLNDQSYLTLDKNSYRQDNLTLTSKLTKKLNAKNTILAGVVIQNMTFEAQRMSSDEVGNTVTIDKPYTISGHNMILSQAYLQWKHNFTDMLYVNTGVNAMYFDLNKSSSLDPRVGLSWQFTDKQTLGFGYGLHSQIQPLNVYFIQSKTGLDTNGRQVYADLGTNKNLGFTKSNQFAVSHNFSFNKNLRLKTEVYYQYLYDVPVKPDKGYFSLINIGAAMSVPEEDRLINAGYGKNYGIEFTFEKFLSQHYYFLVTTSLFNSLYQGADKVWRNTAYNGHYVVNALGGYEFQIKENVMLNTNLRVVYAGGRRITPFDLAQSIKENDTHYLYDQAFEKQVSAYFRTDVRVGVLFQRKKTTHELAIDIVNITNHKNVYRERFDPETKGVKVNYHQGIFPMGLYRLNF